MRDYINFKLNYIDHITLKSQSILPHNFNIYRTLTLTVINGSGGRYDKPLWNGNIWLNTTELARIVGGKTLET